MKRYKGKHIKRVHPQYFRYLITAVLLFTTVRGTSAFLKSRYTIRNEFILGRVNPTIVETFDDVNHEKSDVKIHNSGNVPTYVRVAVVINWKDGNGKTLVTPPIRNTDYTITFSNSTNWLAGNDGYYYYKEILDVDDDTDILIDECTQIQEYNDKSLEVSIITQGIQAEPAKAVREAWGVNVTNNSISLGGV